MHLALDTRATFLPPIVRRTSLCMGAHATFMPSFLPLSDAPRTGWAPTRPSCLPSSHCQTHLALDGRPRDLHAVREVLRGACIVREPDDVRAAVVERPRAILAVPGHDGRRPAEGVGVVARQPRDRGEVRPEGRHLARQRREDVEVRNGLGAIREDEGDARAAAGEALRRQSHAAVRLRGSGADGKDRRVGDVHAREGAAARRRHEEVRAARAGAVDPLVLPPAAASPLRTCSRASAHLFMSVESV